MLTTTIRPQVSPSLKAISKGSASAESKEMVSQLPEDNFVSRGDKQANGWSEMTPIDKVAFTAVSGFVGLVIGGTALLATTALAPIVAGALGVAAGVALGQASTRLSESELTNTQVKERMEKRALEPSSWETSSLAEKAVTLGVSGWIGLSTGGFALGMSGVVPPVAALAIGAGAGAAVGVASLVYSKDSDPSPEPSQNGNSSGLGMTTDGELGFSLGGGVVIANGEFKFGYEI